jgi:hypothetical protein
MFREFLSNNLKPGGEMSSGSVPIFAVFLHSYIAINNAFLVNTL